MIRPFTLSASAAALAAACLFAAPALAHDPAGEAADTIDLSTPEGVLMAQRKLWCSLNDGEVVVWWWHGDAYSRREGERDKKLFDVEGMNIRACYAAEHPERGPGFKTVSREILLYKDPKTGEVLSKWENPWTGESVDVLHVANDPVNGEFYRLGRDGKPVTWSGSGVGDHWWTTNTIPLFYHNVLGGAYQAEVGGTYHATEMFNFMGDKSDLLDKSKPVAEVKVGWARMSDWLPWMKMGGRDGVIYMHTAGVKLDSYDQLSDTMKAEIAEHYPEYAAPPPGDDDRKNETSWTYYLKIKTGELTAPDRSE